MFLQSPLSCIFSSCHSYACALLLFLKKAEKDVQCISLEEELANVIHMLRRYNVGMFQQETPTAPECIEGRSWNAGLPRGTTTLLPKSGLAHPLHIQCAKPINQIKLNTYICFCKIPELWWPCCSYTDLAFSSVHISTFSVCSNIQKLDILPRKMTLAHETASREPLLTLPCSFSSWILFKYFKFYYQCCQQ